MSQATREQVSIALFNLLNDSYAYPFSSRRMKIWDDVALINKPALFLDEEKESHERSNHPTPAVRTLRYMVYIFTQADPSLGSDCTNVPVTQLNDLFDLIDPVQGGILKPNDTMQNRQTLGGLVYDCYIEGQVVKVPGDLDNQGVLIFPVKVIFNR